MPMQKCSRASFAAKIRDVKRLRSKVPADLRPLFNHLLKLSIDSVQRGYCQRAGREIAYARKLYQKHGLGYVYQGTSQRSWKASRRKSR